MPKSFLLEIVTPEKLFYMGDAEIVIARTLEGEEGFMADHSWACKLLGTGELVFREAGTKEYKLAAISGGFIDVRDHILIFTDSAEWAEEVDLERAAAALKSESEWLDTHKAGDKDAGAVPASSAGADGIYAAAGSGEITEDAAGTITEEEIEEHKLAAKRAANRQKVAAGGRRHH